MKTKTKERPILFSGPMVRAILDDRKTQTRRIVKNVPEGLRPGRCHYVDSTWALCEDNGSLQGGRCQCSAGEIKCFYGQPGDRLWVLPRWASRITLEVTGVRVERLQDISENDAYLEGVKLSDRGCETYYTGFRRLWESINGRGSWEANPWVWVIEFQRVEP